MTLREHKLDIDEADKTLANIWPLTRIMSLLK